MKRLLTILFIVLTCCGFLPAAYVKNTASKVRFYAWDTTANAPKTGDAANITAYVSIDGGSVTALTDTSATEASATNAAGCYVFDTTAGEMNGEVLFFSAKTTTSTVYLRPITIATSPAVVSANVTQLAGSATPVTNLNNVYNTDYATAFNEPNGVFNVRLVDVSDSAQLVKLSGGGTSLQTDASGYSKVSPGTGTGQVSLSSGAVTVGTNNDKTGYTASTVSDKTGYSLAADQSAVTIGTVTTLTGHTAQTGDSFARIGAAGASLTALAWNAAWDAQVESEVDDALVANHLDHLFKTTYDPAAKPGAADALFNELVESDAGVSRYTTNALEQAPSGTGGDATAANQTTIISHLTSIKGPTFSETTDQLEDIRDRGDAAWLTGSGTGLTPLASGTAQGGTSTSITLAAGETTLNFKGAICHITGGTGIRQFRVVRQYNPTTKKADIIGKWDVIPDATSTYELSPSPFDYLSLIMGAMAL